MMKNSKRKQSKKSPFIIALQGNDFTKALQLLSKDSFAISSEYLHDYFRNFKGNPISDFECELAKLHPEIYVNAIRNNEVFLNENHIEFLLSEDLLPEPYRIHQKVWGKFHDEEKVLWEAIQKEMDGLKSHPLADILIHCVIQLEVMRFEMGDNTQNVHHLTKVYSFFVEYLLIKRIGEETNLNENEFWNKFIDEVKRISKKKKNITENILVGISNWVHYYNDIICSYCYDLSFEAKQENELIYLKSTPEDFYKWQVDGVRYEINRLVYSIYGDYITDFLAKDGKLIIPIDKRLLDSGLNKKLAEKKQALTLFLHDLSLQKLDFSHEKIDIDQFLIPLHTYSFNRLQRYERTLERITPQCKSWIEAFAKLTMKSSFRGVKNEPYLYMSCDEYKKLNIFALEEKLTDTTDEIIGLFIHEANPKWKFNRFRQNYNVWNKPFVKIGQMLFTPMMPFACNDWFYSFPQEALNKRNKQNKYKDETDEMEQHLAEQLKNDKWTVRVPSNLSKIKGNREGKEDIDIILENDEIAVCIQLKRTKFRLTLKDAHYEFIMVDKKAAKQLNTAESHPDDWGVEGKKVVKWIVTTSLENIGKEIDNCKKINYFFLLHSMRNQIFQSLNDFVKFVEEDELFNKIALGINDMQIANNILPLPIKETVGTYILPIDSEDFEKTNGYNTLFQKALDLDKVGKKEKAITLFKRCIELNPNDSGNYGAMANTLADLRRYDEALKAFQQALKFLPDDPHIIRNYIGALQEIGDFQGAMNIAIKMSKKYPYLADFRRIFEIAKINFMRQRFN